MGPAQNHGIGLIASTGSRIAHSSHPKIIGQMIFSTDENGVPGHITLRRFKSGRIAKTRHP